MALNEPDFLILIDADCVQTEAKKILYLSGAQMSSEKERSQYTDAETVRSRDSTQ